jgi:DNA-binding NtrC family response regulator
MAIAEKYLANDSNKVSIGDGLSSKGGNVNKVAGSMNSVLIVDDEVEIQGLLAKELAKSFSLVEVAENIDIAEALRKRCHFDLIIADIRLSGKSGMAWASELRDQRSSTAVILMTNYANLETAIEALRAGADDFLTKPLHLDELLASVERCMERKYMQHEKYILRRQTNNHKEKAGMIGECQLIRDVCDVIKRVAPTQSTVLLEGESGSGKELAASAIHEWSGRSGSFVPVNCGSMTAELLESELFGHAKGSFTGAHQAREGLFSYARGGTLFLDEIGEMPMPMQTHLLRVLEERTIRPVGSNREEPIDVRIVAATNKDLEKQVAEKTFREDLYYRLNVMGIRIPALRERPEDIPELVQHFNRTLAMDMGLTPVTISESELAHLKAYKWPGNIRELKNAIERSLLLDTAPSQCINGLAKTPLQIKSPVDSGEELLLAAVEKNHILRILEMEGGNKSAAARCLGVSRKTLERKTQAWGLRS